MEKIKEAIENIGMKKICLFAHYGLAIFSSLAFFITSIICLFIPYDFGIEHLTYVYGLIIIYCAIVVGYITVRDIFEDMQTMNKPKTKFDFIAFFIGFSMFVTLGLIITCIVFMFNKSLTDIEFQMWKVLIQVFGGMFVTEAGGGYIYNIFKKRDERLMNEKKDENKKNDLKEPSVGGNG